MKTLSACALIAICSASQVMAQDRGWFTTAQFGTADYDTTQNGAAGSIGDTDDADFEFLFGGGLEYSLTSRLSIGGEAQTSAADYLAGRFVINYAF